MLNDVIIRYASVPDTENSEHFFIEQYEVQIISAIRRVLTLSTVYDPVVLSVNIVYTLITSGVITDRASLGKLMQMVKPLDENVDNSKTILRIEQIKIQVMAKLFLLCFLPDSKLQGPIRSEMTSIVQQNADYWRAKWCVRIRKALMEQKDANEYALYLLVAMALVNQEQVSKKEEPNYELQQLVLIVGGIMSALNELLADQQENPSLLTCLIALRLCEPFVQFIPGERVLDDFVEYVLHVLDVLLQSPLMQKSSKLRDQLYNESIELFTGILPFVKMAREEGKTIATLQPKQVRNKVTVRKESKEKKGRSVEKENEDEYEYVSEYCYESYYSYETDDEEEEKKEAMEKKANQSQKEVEKKEPKEVEKKEEEQSEMKKEEEQSEVKPEVKPEVKVNEEKEAKVESEEKPKEEVKEEPKEAEVKEEPKEVEVKEEVVKEEPKEELKEEPQKEEVKEEPKEESIEEPKEEPKVDSKDSIRSTALARSEAKLEVDEHLWDSDDEPAKPARTSRRSRRATKPVKEEPKEMPKEEVKEEPKEESKEETKEEVKKDSKDNIRSTALARSEAKLEVDEHLWDSDDEPAKPARTSRRSRRATSRPMYRIVEESPLGAAPPDSEESSDDESPRRTRSRVGRGKKLESFEASWDNEEEEGAGENWEDSKADESWGFDDETPKKNETPKKEEVEKKVEEDSKKVDEVQKEEEPKKVEEEPKKEETPIKKEETPIKKEETPRKEQEPKKEETPIKKEETPKREETPIKKEETPLPSSSSSPFIADPLQGNPLSLFATPPLSSSSSSSSSLFWSILHVCDLLLTAAPFYLPCSRALRSCLALFPDRPDVRSFFAGRLFDLLKSHELPASESRVLLALLTDLAAPDLPLRKSLLDSIVETALSLLSQPDKLPLIAQLLQLAHALYALHTEPWMLQHFVVLFHAFANAAAATAERAAFVLSAFVELAPKLKIDHLRFFIATCAVEVIGMVVPRVNEFGKKELSALVQFAALCYGKTEKKNEVVDLVIRLNALALDRSVALQPMDVSKAVEDPEITKINGMIGEILFVVATANADRMKITIQQLPAASATNLQNQLRKTVQVKQMESSAARRRNANRMPVKLDASKFTQ